MEATMNTFNPETISATDNASVRSSCRTSRVLSRLATVTLLTSLALGTVAMPLISAAPKAEKKGGKSIQRSFSSSDAITINDNQEADPYPSTIKVSGLKKSKVTDVNVVIRDFSHDFPANVDIVLEAPNGSSTVLMSDVGAGTSVQGLTLTLDDQSGNTLPSTTEFESGTYKPTNLGNTPDLFPTLSSPPTGALLADLNGGNPNGEWRLFVVDDQGVDTGEISGGWKLELTAKAKAKKKHGGKH
jgi:subtilisin-like proprotein convertase family protein